MYETELLICPVCKKAVYDTPYVNDEQPPETGILKLTETIKVSDRIRLDCSEDIMALFSMTPYYYRTSKQDIAKLEAMNELDTEVEFVMFKYRVE